MIEVLWALGRDGLLAGARQCGSHGSAIIFVHGVGSTAAIWDYQLRSLGDMYRCYAIELRGNGVAPAPPESISRQGFVEDVLAIADAERIGRFHFVGCSLGGVVGFELWKQAPERVASLTFVGSFAAYPNAQAYADGVKAAARTAGDMETFAKERVGTLGLPPGQRTDETIAQMACKTPDCYIASTQATWTGDYRATLSTITVPTLVVVGERDAIAPLALSQEIANGIPGARLEIIANAGHVTNADAPDAFNSLLREFLDTRYSR
jgi:pimeloyl-ACP methyl ester carboxylesterase